MIAERLNRLEDREIREDGLIVNVETGEIVDVKVPDEHYVDGQTKMTRGLAEWVTGRILEKDAAIQSADIGAQQAAAAINEIQAEYQAKIEADPRYIAASAVLRNAESMKSAFAHERDFFIYRFADDLKRWIRLETLKSKTRSVKTIFGTIGLRRTQGKLGILDESKAAEIAERIGLGDKVRKAVSVSDLKPSVFKAFTEVSEIKEQIERASACGDMDKVSELAAELERAEARSEPVMQILAEYPAVLDVQLPEDKLEIKTGVSA